VKFTRARDLVLVGVIAAVGANLLLLVGYDSLPPLPTLAGGLLFVLAVLELVSALVLRPRLAHKPGTRPVPPLQAVRVVALAKASSLLGAIMGGAALGALVYLLPKRAQLAVAGHDTANAVITLISAAALIAAALWLEYCCRAPEDPDDQTRSS
jgi:Mn2+/Fe2+ NRAMP family transporter